MDMKKNILNKFVVTIDIVLLVSIGLMHYFSSTRMGMMRFLVYQNKKLIEGWFSQDLFNLYEYILIIVMLLCAYNVFFEAINMKGLKLCKTSIFAVVIGFILYFVLVFKDARELKVYYFMLIALFIIFFLQLILVGYKLVTKVHKK